METQEIACEDKPLVLEGKEKRAYEKVNPKIPLTERELDFLTILIEKNVSVEKAVYQAGYKHCSMNQRYNIGRKIIKKYEDTGPGGRILFRDVGFGELTVGRRVRHLGEKSKNDMVALRACELAMRAMGLLEREQEGAAGVQIVIQATGNSATQVNVTAPGPAPADPVSTVTVSYQHPADEPGKPVQITK